LCPKEADIRIVDEYVEPIPFEEEFDVIGITANTCLAPRAYEIADAFMERGQTVVLGGIHPSLIPDEAKEHASSVVIGEAENTFPNLIDDFRRGKLAPIYRSEKHVDLASSPLPRWDLISTGSYSNLMIQSSRGCPYDCEFCSVKAFLGRKYRWKPIDAVMAEAKALEIFGKETLFWADDNLVANRKRILQLLKEINPLQIRFFAQVSIDLANDEELLSALARSGCKRVIIGFESLDQATLKSMKKGRSYNADLYEEQIRRIQATGIEVFGSFVFGFDGDREGVFEKTAGFIQNTGMSVAILNILTPYPGTDVYHRLEAEGRILNKDWSRYDGTKACFQPANMSPEELEEGYDWVRNRVFSYDSIFQRLEKLYRLWNETGVRKWDRISPILVNLESHAAAYGGPPFERSDDQDQTAAQDHGGHG